MRVLVVSTQVPFTYGGAEIHSQSLVDELIKAGHEAEQVQIPYKWYPAEKILDHLLACRMIDITQSNGVPVDRVIGLRFPAYHIPHPNKVLWILHQHRTAFELWGADECDLSRFPRGKEIRDAIEQAERSLLPEAKAIYANSANVAGRLKRFCDVDAEPLYHPPRHAEKFYNKEAEDYLYYPSRLAPLKRQELVIEALAETRKPVKVVFAGKPDNPAYIDDLKKLARKLKVEDRIKWLGLVNDVTMLDSYARCLGVIFPPKDEDYGYITLEAMLSSKPVITCEDSGGPLEFVVDNETGYVAGNTAKDLGEAMDRLWGERTFANEAGKRGRARLDALGVNWQTVIQKLTA